jgi:ubiquinone/menaquinone biosynthesis C-methylase UbiE
MTAKIKPETIENRWDILYRDYPEVYDEFASIPKTPKWIDVINRWFNLKGETVVDIGSGSGLSTFALSKWAKSIIGVEPEDAMMKIAVKNAKKINIRNVKFVKGYAEKIPLKNCSVDIVIAVTVASFYKERNIRLFVKEANRILVNNGFIISVDIAPKWYGGELAPVILGKTRCEKSDSEEIRNRVFTSLGFKHKDFYQIQKYDSMKKILSTYGFIFGKKAIEHLKKHKKTRIRWKFRVYYHKVKK